MKISFGLIMLALSLKAVASPILEEFGAMTVDWSNQVVRFTVAMNAPGDTWKESETKARDLARETLLKSLDTLFMERQGGVDVSILESQRTQIKSRVKSWAYSKYSEYGADGVMRATIEMKLKRLMPLATISAPSAPASSQGVSVADATGIIFKIKSQTLPMATFKINESTLGVVYGVHNLKSSAYERNLMAKWFKAPLAPEEQRAVVGDRPAVVELTPQKNGEFLVSQTEWAKVAKVASPLLSEAKALVLVQ